MDIHCFTLLHSHNKINSNSQKSDKRNSHHSRWRLFWHLYSDK